MQTSLELDSRLQHMGNMLEKMRVTIDKDLDVCHQIIEGGFEKAKVTIDKDLDQFMKSVAFFQR